MQYAFYTLPSYFCFNVLLVLLYMYILNHVCIYLIHIIYPSMLRLNLMLFPLFPFPFPPPTPLLKLLYNTGVYNIFVKMVLCGCRSECGVLGLLTEISNNGGSH